MKLSIALYKLMLYLYPRTFRREYGDLMAQVFADLCRDMGKQHGLFGMMRLWGRTLLDLFVTVPKEQLEAFGYRRTQLMDVKAFNTQLNDTVLSFIADLRDGYSVLQCIERVSDSAPEPTASEFKLMLEDVQSGTKWPVAIGHMQARVQSKPLGEFIATMHTQLAEGGNLADRLEILLDKFASNQ